MKAKPAGQTNLIEGGRERLENTDEFKQKVEQIEGEVRDKYSVTLSKEKNWIKRILILIRRDIEIGKRISEVSSSKNLHIVHHWQV